jgi:hypothetical protein
VKVTIHTENDGILFLRRGPELTNKEVTLDEAVRQLGGDAEGSAEASREDSSKTAAHRTAMKRLDAMRGIEAQENPRAPKIPGDEDDES